MYHHETITTLLKKIDHCSVSEFVDREKSKEKRIDAVVVAGVGSSAIGTASLARNLADYLKRPVAGIVSGCGVEDVISEGFGGWFGLGAINAAIDSGQKAQDKMIEQATESVKILQTSLNISTQISKQIAGQIYNFSPSQLESKFPKLNYGANFYENTIAAYKRSPVEAIADFVTDSFIRSSDIEALKALLVDDSKINLLVGHSKGSLIISSALYKLERSLKELPALHVLTLGAVVRFPEQLNDVKQYLGEIDVLGKMNSRNLHQINHQLVPNAWHTLNPNLDGCMPVKEIFAEVFP